MVLEGGIVVVGGSVVGGVIVIFEQSFPPSVMVQLFGALSSLFLAISAVQYLLFPPSKITDGLIV